MVALIITVSSVNYFGAGVEVLWQKEVQDGVSSKSRLGTNGSCPAPFSLRAIIQ